MKTKLVAASALSALAAMVVWVVGSVFVFFGPASPLRFSEIDSADWFFFVGMSLAIFWPVSVSVVAVVGIPLFFFRRKKMDAGRWPFTLAGLSVGAVLFPLFWMAFGGRFEYTVAVTGGAAGVVAGLVFWAMVRGGLVRDIVRDR